MLIKRGKSFILLLVGFFLGILFYWSLHFTFVLSGKESKVNSFRIIASSTKVSDKLKDCSQIKNITNKDNINIHCSFTTNKRDRGVRYGIRSTVTIKKDASSDKATISVRNKLKNKRDHITEADYCTGCSEDVTLDLKNLDDLQDVSKAIFNSTSSLLSREEDRIEDAIDDAYELKKEKKRLEKEIASCKVSKDSTVEDIVDIEPEEKIRCRMNQLENINDDVKRTKFFHSDVKKDLWYLVDQDDPLDPDFFQSELMEELNNPDFFNHDYFSVRSSIDLVEKYNHLRLFMDKLGDNKLTALNNISMQLPFYFHTDANTYTGKGDRILLEKAWNKNFKKRRFPTYYSLSNHSTRAKSSRRNNRGMSAQQFRSIVNSPEFQKLYR